MSPSLPLLWYGRRRSSLFYGWIVAWLPSSLPDTQCLGCCFSVWHLGRFSVTMLCVGSASYYVPPSPFPEFFSFALHVGVSIRVALALGASSHALSRGLAGHVGPLVCCVRLPARFSSHWSCSLPPPCQGSSMCLARQAQVSSSHIAFLVFV